MRIVEQIAKNIWKLQLKSNMYLLNFDEPIVIDTGTRSDRNMIKMYLDKLRPFNEVRHVIFTHLHYDHIGNFDLFTNAEFYASEREIECLKTDPEGTVLSKEMAEKFKVVLLPVRDFKDLKIIETPGHTAGSICIWYAPERILFSGDTIFANKQIGRVDLPTSEAEAMNETVMALVDYNFRILCPGHDY